LVRALVPKQLLGALEIGDGRLERLVDDLESAGRGRRRLGIRAVCIAQLLGVDRATAADHLAIVGFSDSPEAGINAES
jgi:hypothetical protein